ncbi:hypothetical protein MTR67_044122 [Solanum verrucosum]|uniref:Tf2-1-like SH3-like domain-containing protein n=1 Tax=Solanum verrucosum TaxID=315347 RepID=A0AAF0UQN8_SOLVR|nr:hypothetical protein MTR67_044122 [Solanum verrucosum]
MLSQAVTNQVGQRENRQEVADTSRIREFLRMNLQASLVQGRSEGAPILSLAVFRSALLRRFFPRELREAKQVEEDKLRDTDLLLDGLRISKRIGNVVYEWELPQKLAAVRLVFHISMLKKCMCHPSLIIPTEDIGIKDTLSYKEIPVQSLDRQVCKLRTKEVALIKVLWRNQFVEEATWEAEEDMKKRKIPPKSVQWACSKLTSYSEVTKECTNSQCRMANKNHFRLADGATVLDLEPLFGAINMISGGETIGTGGLVSVASSGTNVTCEAGGTASSRAAIGAREAGTRGTGDPPCASEGNLSL